MKCVERRYRLVISCICLVCICFCSFFLLCFVFKSCLCSFNRLFCLFQLSSVVLVLCFSFIKSFLCHFLSLFACSFFFDCICLFVFSVSKTFAIESLLCVFYFCFGSCDSSFSLSHFCLFSTNRFALNSNITVSIVFFSLRRRYRLFFGRNVCFCSFHFLLCILNSFRCCFVSNFLSICLSLFQVSEFLFCLIRCFISLIQNTLCLIGIFLGLFSSSTKFSDFFLSRSFHFYFLRRFLFHQGWFGLCSCR